MGRPTANPIAGNRLSGWSKVAVKTNPITHAIEAMRATTLDGWE